MDKGGARDADSLNRVSALPVTVPLAYSLKAADINGASINPPAGCIDASAGDTLMVEIRGCPEDAETYFGTALLKVSEAATGMYSLCLNELDANPLSPGSDCECLTINVWPLYGDLDGSGVVDIDDLTCVVRCFETSGLECPNGDIAPCGGDGLCDVDDLVAVVGAFDGP
jgi:hypothetical protein